MLPHAAAGRPLASRPPSGRASFTVSPLEVLHVPAGRLLLQTLRSHDQYNTTIYGLDDRYRGIHGGRRVVFVHPDDLAELGFADGDLVDLVSEWTDGAERRAETFRLVAYPTAKGCAAAYFPEANVLVHKENVARVSNTPGFKAMFVRFEPHAAGLWSRLRWRQPPRPDLLLNKERRRHSGNPVCRRRPQPPANLASSARGTLRSWPQA